MEMKPLQEHQHETVDFTVRNDRVIIADKMGLGKTRSALTAAIEREKVMRMLISAKASSLYTWKNEILKWFPAEQERIVLIEGNKDKRVKLWRHAKTMRDPIMISTHEVFRNDLEEVPSTVDCFAIDEAHKIRNRKSQLYKACQQIDSELAYLVSGSIAKKGVQDTYAPLHLLRPDRFTSYWGFINKFMIVEKGQFGMELLGVQNMDILRQEIANILIRHKKPKDMPPLVRQPLYVQTTPEERRVIDIIEEDMILQLKGGEYLLSPTRMTSLLRCRQLLVCPKLIDPGMGYGSGIKAILDHVEDNELDKFVIFSPFPAAFPYLQEYIQDRLSVTTQVLRGGITGQQQQDVLKWFTNCKRGGILNSIQYAEGYDLMQANVCYLLGFEWNPDDNFQAEDRLHRLGIEDMVNSFWILHESPIAAWIKGILDGKFTEINQIYEDRNALKEHIQKS